MVKLFKTTFFKLSTLRYKIRDELKGNIQCIIQATLTKKEFEFYQKHTKNEKEAVIDILTEEFVSGIRNQTNKKVLKKVYKAVEKKQNNILGCLANHTMEIANMTAQITKSPKSDDYTWGWGHLCGICGLKKIIGGGNFGLGVAKKLAVGVGAAGLVVGGLLKAGVALGTAVAKGVGGHLKAGKHY